MLVLAEGVVVCLTFSEAVDFGEKVGDRLGVVIVVLVVDAPENFAGFIVAL